MSIKNKRYGNVEYLKADGIKAPHCFTTRLTGVSTGIWESMNIAMHRGDADANVAENYRILGKCIGFEPEDLVLSHQTHSDIVRRVGRADHMGLDHRISGVRRPHYQRARHGPGGLHRRLHPHFAP